MKRWPVVAVVAVILGINAFAIYRSMHANDAVLNAIPPSAQLAPPVNSDAARQVALDEKPVDLTWPVIQKTKVINSLGEARIDFAPEVQSADNCLVRLSGVLFFLKDGIKDGKVQWCVLMPPSRMTCCGITCDPRQELMFFVDCSKNPWPKPDARMVAVVQGRLHLRHDDANWSLYSIEDAAITPPKEGVQ
jgi:hypothetical protein